ncbi:MAG: ACP S-malonyltransferase [Bacteroidia bacterium]|nr:ACP S-malonyltransferase [Bacteroidia bacterium]
MKFKHALIFPVFGREYCGDEVEILSRYSDEFKNLLKRATEGTGIDISCFDIINNNFLDDELKSQLMAYVFSCNVSDILKKKNIYGDYLAGYSMGLYAALYHAGVYSFEEGAYLIMKAYQTIISEIEKQRYGMGTIGGIDHDDLADIIAYHNSDTEIININSRHSFVISGKYEEVKTIVQHAFSEGALLARMLPVSVPYHSKYMMSASNKFKEYIVPLDFCNPVIPVVSLVDQRLITTSADVMQELINNIGDKINWYKTILKLCALEVKIMLECGAGKSLYKIGKFFDQEIKIYPLSRILQFIERII